MGAIRPAQPPVPAILTNAAMLLSTPLRLIVRFCALLLLLMAAPALAAGPGWKVVLIAGDHAQPVFDNAVNAMAHWLLGRGVPLADIHRLSASPRDPGAEPATLHAILQRIASLQVRPGERCLVFVTSHGGRDEGAWLAHSGEHLPPAALAQALAIGCGNVPTVVILSACYSGIYSRGPMVAPNRIILTAARPDRPSFGCQADRTYTVFDECLLGSVTQAPTWQALYHANLACVLDRERRMKVQPSQPQAAIGAAVRDLALP